jgi:uncharacterized protein (DUF927 family)
VSFLKDETTKAHFIEITFPTRGRESDSIQIGAEERAEDLKVVRQLASRNADLPEKRAEQKALVQAVVASAPTNPVVLTSKPGFRGGDGFVMPNRSYGTAGGIYRWAEEAEPEGSLGQQSDSELQDYNRTVAQAALYSPYVSFGIMLALAGPLPTYVLTRSRGKVVPETALFNIAGDTTTGKTLVAMAAAGACGSPNALIDWDTTMRGVSEACASRNDLVLVLDDTEKFPGDERELRKMVHALVQKIPGGRSRTIAKKAQAGGLPPLTWSTFGLSTSTTTLYSLLDLARKPASGDRVRGLDIRVPKRSKGGIFGASVIGTDSTPENNGEAIKRLETALQEHYGVLFPAWIEHLLNKDLSDEILRRVALFVRNKVSKSDPADREKVWAGICRRSARR